MDKTGSHPPRTEKVRPYPAIYGGSMRYITEFTLMTAPPGKNHECDHQHEAPALVFSGGGHTGNFFHEFVDGFIPLFFTVLTFFRDHDLILAIVDLQEGWFNKYAALLRLFTPYPIINLDKENSTHCFPYATLGVINHNHGEVNIEPKLLPNFENISNFRDLLSKAFGRNTTRFPRESLQRPRLVVINRSGNASRIIVNIDEVKKVAEEVGFEVIIYKPDGNTSLSDGYELMNTSHAFFGVHGAGLTHSIFLRPGSVFIQVIPMGLDWLARTSFGKLGRELGLQYMEYNIQVKESTLVDKYGKDDIVLKNPRYVLHKLNFGGGKSIYLRNQDVRLDLEWVRRFLKEAYRKAIDFMNREG